MSLLTAGYLLYQLRTSLVTTGPRAISLLFEWLPQVVLSPDVLSAPVLAAFLVLVCSWKQVVRGLCIMRARPPARLARISSQRIYVGVRFHASRWQVYAWLQSLLHVLTMAGLPDWRCHAKQTTCRKPCQVAVLY